MRFACLFGALIAVTVPAAAQQSDTGSQPDSAAKREIEWMSAVTKQLTSSLVDPASAHITLPYGFTPQPATWKVWGVDMRGYFTCGAVNSRNRMGGYVGETIFLAHISLQGQVTTTLDSSKYPVLGRVCASGGLPPIKPTTVAAIFRPAPQDAGASLTKQLADLADLHRKGAISDEEFAAAKARIIGSN
jgi:hypothetical protein